MPDTFEDFTSGLSSTLDPKFKDEAEAEAKRKIENVMRAEDAYSRKLKPIFDALAALPLKDGEKFHVQETPGDRRFGLWPYADLTYNAEGFPKDDTPILRFRVYTYLREESKGGKIVDSFYNESTDLTFAGVGKRLGDWINFFAPNRIPEVSAAMKALAPKPPGGPSGQG